MGSLFGGSKGGSSQTTTTTSSKNLPSWLEKEIHSIRDSATGLFNKPYEAYGGQKLADLNPNQLRVMSEMESLPGRYNPLLDASQASMQAVASSSNRPPTPEEIAQYMNPYVSNVADITKGRAVEDYTKQVMDIRNRAAAANAFGGDRRFILEGQANQDISRNLADIDYIGKKDAYDRAMEMRTADRTFGMQAGQSLADLAKLRQGLDMSGLAALEEQADKKYDYDQMGLDQKYEDWMAEKAYPYEQLQFYNSMLQPYASDFGSETQTQVVTQPKQKKSGLSKFLGTALSIGSMFIPGMQGVGIASSLGSSIGRNMLMGGISNSLSSAFGGRQSYGPGFKYGGIVELAEGGSVNSKAQRVREEMNDFNPVKNYLESLVNRKDINDKWESIFGSRNTKETSSSPVKTNSTPAKIAPKRLGPAMSPSLPEKETQEDQDDAELNNLLTGILSGPETQGQLTLNPLLMQSSQNNTQPTPEKGVASSINIPLLKAGISLLTSEDPDVFANVGRGLEAYIDTRTGLEQQAREIEAAKQKMELERMAKEAYARQVEAQMMRSGGRDGTSPKPISEKDFGNLVKSEVKRLSEIQNDIMFKGDPMTDAELWAQAKSNVQSGLEMSAQEPDLAIPAAPRGMFADVGSGQQPLGNALTEDPAVQVLLDKYEKGLLNDAEFQEEILKLQRNLR